MADGGVGTISGVVVGFGASVGLGSRAKAGPSVLSTDRGAPAEESSFGLRWFRIFAPADFLGLPLWRPLWVVGFELTEIGSVLRRFRLRSSRFGFEVSFAPSFGPSVVCPALSSIISRTLSDVDPQDDSGVIGITTFSLVCLGKAFAGKKKGWTFLLLASITRASSAIAKIRGRPKRSCWGTAHLVTSTAVAYKVPNPQYSKKAKGI